MGANAQAIFSGSTSHSSYSSYFLSNTSGSPRACGNNSNGQLGDGTKTDRSMPVRVSGLSGVTAISAGESHCLFLKKDSSVWSCGSNEDGQLGDGTDTDRLTPVKLSGLTGIIAIA
ncbi:MAG: RCC1 repeat-containing protein, partial [Bacteroidia bacterium]